MATCAFTGGRLQGCRDNTGGIAYVYLTNLDNLTGIAVDATDIITGLTMSGSTKFYKFEPNKNSAEFVEKATVNVENGTYLTNQTLTMSFTKKDYDLRNQIKLMLLVPGMLAIIEDKNGKFFLAGYQYGLDLTDSNGTSGKGMSDMNGWTLTLSGDQKDPAQEVSAAAVAAVI